MGSGQQAVIGAESTALAASYASKVSIIIFCQSTTSRPISLISTLCSTKAGCFQVNSSHRKPTHPHTNPPAIHSHPPSRPHSAAKSQQSPPSPRSHQSQQRLPSRSRQRPTHRIPIPTTRHALRYRRNRCRKACRVNSSWINGYRCLLQNVVE